MDNVRKILEKKQGLTSSIKNIFSYHYDQIVRELHAECHGLDNPDKENLSVLEYLLTYMEDDINWPDTDTIEEFIASVTQGESEPPLKDDGMVISIPSKTGKVWLGTAILSTGKYPYTVEYEASSLKHVISTIMNNWASLMSIAGVLPADTKKPPIDEISDMIEQLICILYVSRDIYGWDSTKFYDMVNKVKDGIILNLDPAIKNGGQQSLLTIVVIPDPDDLSTTAYYYQLVDFKRPNNSQRI